MEYHPDMPRITKGREDAPPHCGRCGVEWRSFVWQRDKVTYIPRCSCWTLAPKVADA